MVGGSDGSRTLKVEAPDEGLTLEVQLTQAKPRKISPANDIVKNPRENFIPRA